LTMAHKPAPKLNEVPTFVSSSLTVELKPSLAAWADRNCNELVAHIESAVMAGYAFGCKAEEKVGFQASLRHTENANLKVNQGKVLVERAGSVTRAISRLFWAHEELFEQTWPGGAKSIDDDW
jgi:hypothetical protein